MTSRERVRRAVTFGQPDRTPIDLWTMPATERLYGDALAALLARHPLDIARGGYCSAWAEGVYRAGEFRDAWGVVWQNVHEGVAGQPKVHPLADYANLAHYRPPLGTAGDGFEDLDDFIAVHRDKFITGGSLQFFERMQWVRGMEDLLVDLATDRPEVYILRDMVLDYLRAHLAHWLEHDLDAITFSDDWGSQEQLLISPRLWRRFFRPCYQELFDMIHGAGKLIFFHSDGYTMEIIGDLIEMGVDALNTQLACMDLAELGRRFAGRICFWGEVDRQWVLARGTPDDVRAACRTIKAHLELPSGGLIGLGTAFVDTPLENIEALLTSW